MKIIMVVGPFNDHSARQRELNIVEAIRAAKHVLACGHFPICPHLNTGLFYGVHPEGLFRAGYLDLLRRCDGILTCCGWEKSEGASAEVALAKQLNIPIYGAWHDLPAAEKL
jgi:hypothetical protein